MPDSDKRLHPEVEHNLSYLGVFAPELLSAGHGDLAAEIRDESNLTPARFEAIINVGLELRIDVALAIAKRQRAVRILLEEEGPEFNANGVNRILQFVDAEWGVMREKRLYRFDEVNERHQDFELAALDSEDGPWDASTSRLREFDDLFELYFERFLRDHGEELRTFTSDDMDTIILDLPGDFQESFDRQYRDPLEEEFRTKLGSNWVDLINERADLWRIWDTRFTAVAKAFLMEVYRGKIAPGIQQSAPEDGARVPAHARRNHRVPLASGTSFERIPSNFERSGPVALTESGISADTGALTDGERMKLNRRVTQWFSGLATDFRSAGRGDVADRLDRGGDLAKNSELGPFPPDLETVLNLGMEMRLRAAFGAEWDRLFVEFIVNNVTHQNVEEVIDRLEDLLDLHDGIVGLGRASTSTVPELSNAVDAVTGLGIGKAAVVDLLTSIESLSEKKGDL